MKPLPISTVAAITLLAGCTVGPRYVAPTPSVPARYAAGIPELASTNRVESSSIREWWRVFNDSALDALVRDALQANFDLQIARQRVLESRALRAGQIASFFPNVNGSGRYTRNRSSENTPTGQQLRGAGGSLEQGMFDAGFDVSWELDLFGAVQHRVEAATAEQESQVEAVREIQTTVMAEVGRTYFELRGAQRRLDVIIANVRSQEETLRLIRDREQAGLASALDIARASAQVSNSRSQIPLLQSERQLAVHRLSVLTGRFPTELETQLANVAPIPSLPPRIPLGLPSDLLHQRPDLRRLERQLAAATARSGVATAELFPRFFLTGAAGVQSAQASDLIDAGSRFWSLGPGLQWPVFSAGRLRQNVKAADARTEQALLRYEQGIRLTLEEVENALVVFGREQDRRKELSDSEVASRRAAVLANERYRGGLVDFLDVLEAERTLLAAQDSLAVSDQMLGQQLVRLFKALGGGWEIETKPTVAASRSVE